MNQAQEELLRSCPYNPVHKVKRSRFLIHLLKCRKAHADKNFTKCPFSAEHVVPAHKLMDHVYCCPLNFTAEVFAAKTGNVDKPCPFSKKDSVFWDNLRLKKRVFLFVFVVVLGLLLTIAWFFSRDKVRAGSEKALLCLTDDCREYALYLDFRRNLSVDPCNDFYTHVCSSWQPPYGYGQIASTAMAEIMIKWIRSFAEFLDQAASTSEVGKKPQALFEACVADRSTDLSDVKRFRGFLSELNLSWPEPPPVIPSALGVLIDLSLNWHDTFWLTLRVDAGNDSQTEKRRRKRLLITPGNEDTLAFFARNHFHVLKHNAYMDYWKMHFKALYDNQTIPLTEKDIFESCSLQTMVVNLLLDAMKRKSKVPLLIPLSRIGDYTGRLNSSLWLDQLNSHVNERFSFTGEDEAFVEDRYYLEAIGELFTKYDDEVLLRQMSWEFVQTHIVVLDKAPLEIALWGEVHAARYIPLYCAMYVEDVYRPLLAYLYSTSRLTYRDRLLVNTGLESVVRQVTRKVNTSWLSESSKATALQKYMSMRFRLWPPDLPQEEVERFYRCFPNSGRSFVQIWIEGHECMRRVPDTPFQESSRGMHSVISSRSFIYDYLSNSIDVAITTFSRPVYYSYGTRAMFYGGVGFLFASQIMKAQDPTGLSITANESVVEGSWMAPYDSDEFQNRVQCLGNGTEDYLVSHVAALEVAYSAFAAGDDIDYSRRPISRNLTEAQVFFLMLCHAMCHVAKPVRDLSTDCNMLLKNSPHFSEAFHCARGSPMNPERKCGFFE
ncbi:membrane metallo-endopeptidase-like 1 [Rhipicephalus sanguineus]|uniref:membrane metallo-endopeptidase-like 1 n=1 Tax=Rhipicephalus sanguineus TaxID=34632 RepID=UPI0020C4804C|nr:membrane metallo-endopeptidase-like 1 [Rhipicephalus sanguineus]